MVGVSDKFFRLSFFMGLELCSTMTKDENVPKVDIWYGIVADVKYVNISKLICKNYIFFGPSRIVPDNSCHQDCLLC